MRKLLKALRIAFTVFRRALIEHEDMIFGKIDPITELGNLNAFNEYRYKLRFSYSLIYLDIDDFKKLNDSKGHDFGDQMLRFLGKSLKNITSFKGDSFRLHGDEFIVIIRNQYCFDVCDQIQKTISDYGYFTVSLGTLMHLSGPVTDNYLKIADSLMYKIKMNGKGTITIESMKNFKAIA
jgi:diguanylate cyclase (GGDEF)-like protein